MQLNPASAILPHTAACCAQARELALRIEDILVDAASSTEQAGALRLAQALTGTLLDELDRLQHQRAAR